MMTVRKDMSLDPERLPRDAQSIVYIFKENSLAKLDPLLLTVKHEKELFGYLNLWKLV